MGAHTEYLAKLDRLIATATKHRYDVAQAGDRLCWNDFLMLDMVEAGAALDDNWSDWAEALNHELNTDRDGFPIGEAA